MKALTTKQRALMRVIMAGNVDKTGARASDVDYTQILDRLSYGTTRESLMCSIRILRLQGWIEYGGKEIRDGRAKQTVRPTHQADRLLDHSANQVGMAELEYIDVGDDDIVVLELD